MCLHDRVDERTDRRRPRPQREQEADRDDLRSSALEHVRHCRTDDLVDDAFAEDRPAERDDLGFDDLDGVGSEPPTDIADHSEKTEQQGSQ